MSEITDAGVAPKCHRRYERGMRISWLVLVLVLVAACGSSSSRTTTNPDATGAGDGAVSSDGSIAQGTACGTGHVACAATEYCDYADNDCGAVDTGTCKPRPDVCPAVVGAPVCGCDGAVYASSCTAFHGGTDLDAKGGCTAAPGHFRCGYDQCETASEYCRHTPGSGGGADTYACAAVPLACAGAPSCSCLRGESCGDMCTGDPATGLTLMCPAQ